MVKRRVKTYSFVIFDDRSGGDFPLFALFTRPLEFCIYNDKARLSK